MGISHGRQWICISTRVWVRVRKGSGVFVLSSGSDWIPSVTEWNALLNGSRRERGHSRLPAFNPARLSMHCLLIIAPELVAVLMETHIRPHTHTGMDIHCIHLWGTFLPLSYIMFLLWAVPIVQCYPSITKIVLYYSIWKYVIFNSCLMRGSQMYN